MKQDDYNKLIKNLKHWNESDEGRNSHCTANPIFEVQEKIRVYGFDSDYSDKWSFVLEDAEFETVEEVLETLELDEIKKLCDDKTLKEFRALPEWQQIDSIISRRANLEFSQVYYKEEWKHVNTHLTREGAETFIKRKQHDHGELRIYVNSLYWCWEFKELIKSLINGELTFNAK